MSLRTPEKLVVQADQKYQIEQIKTLTTLRGRTESIPKIKSFEQIKQKYGSHAEAFSAISGRLSEPEAAEKYGFNESERTFMKTASLLGSFVDASLESHSIRNELNGQKPNKAQKERLGYLILEHLIPFNHSLKEFVNQNPDLNINRVSELLLETYAEHYDDKNLVTGEDKGKITPQELNEAEYQVLSALRGMRTEVAAETILTAAGVEYSYHIRPEADKAGVDMLIMVDGRLEPVDIKSSLTGEKKAHEDWDGSRAVWLGLRDSDYTGSRGILKDSLTLPFSRAEEAAPDFVHRLNEIISYAKQVESHSKIGSKVLAYS